MLVVSLYRENERVSLLAKGHTGYAEEGKDIICAAVSALLQTFSLWLSEEYKDKFKLEKRKGFLHMEFPMDEKSNLVLWVFWRGLIEISRSYPAYVKCEEVKRE